jgi:AcrR family transcriptional regulator
MFGNGGQRRSNVAGETTRQAIIEACAALIYAPQPFPTKQAILGEFARRHGGRQLTTLNAHFATLEDVYRATLRTEAERLILDVAHGRSVFSKDVAGEVARAMLGPWFTGRLPPGLQGRLACFAIYQHAPDDCGQ